jgi:hypothetical protein
MFVSLFDVRVEDVTVNELSVNLKIKDGSGNHITIFFNSIDEVRNFSREVRAYALNEANIAWSEFDRPKLITD